MRYTLTIEKEHKGRHFTILIQKEEWVQEAVLFIEDSETEEILCEKDLPEKLNEDIKIRIDDLANKALYLEDLL